MKFQKLSEVKACQSVDIKHYNSLTFSEIFGKIQACAVLNGGDSEALKIFVDMVDYRLSHNLQGTYVLCVGDRT